MADYLIEGFRPPLTIEVTPRNNGEHEERSLSEIASEIAFHFEGATTASRILNWLLTFPEDDIKLGLKVLDNLRFIDLTELRQTRFDACLKRYPEGNLLLTAPVKPREFGIGDSSATIISSWLQEELVTGGYEVHQRFFREGHKVMPAGIFTKGERGIVITDSYTGWDRDIAKREGIGKFNAVVFYDDWSISGTHFSRAARYTDKLLEAEIIDESTKVGIAYGYMTREALEKNVAILKGKVQHSVDLVGAEEDGFNIAVIEEMFEPWEVERLNELTRYAYFSRDLSSVLVTSAISAPDNLHNIVKQGVCLEQGKKEYPLILDPRTGQRRQASF